MHIRCALLNLDKNKAYQIKTQILLFGNITAPAHNIQCVRDYGHTVLVLDGRLRLVCLADYRVLTGSDKELTVAVLVDKFLQVFRHELVLGLHHVVVLSDTRVGAEVHEYVRCVDHLWCELNDLEFKCCKRKSQFLSRF
jgi:hypothetical protein